MRIAMIALANSKGGIMDFWEIIRDDGRELKVGDFRFKWDGHNTEQVKTWLREAKRNYAQDYKYLIEKQRRAMCRYGKAWLNMVKEEAKYRANQEEINRFIKNF